MNILCPLCHTLHCHKSRILIAIGIKLPALTDAAMIWLKRERDTDNYDAEFIESIWLGNPPEPVEPDGWFMSEYERRR